jgi:hypothetical protein
MELLVLVLALVAGLALLDAAALTWGVDSREPIADDHRR